MLVYGVDPQVVSLRQRLDAIDTTDIGVYLELVMGISEEIVQISWSRGLFRNVITSAMDD